MLRGLLLLSAEFQLAAVGQQGEARRRMEGEERRARGLLRSEELCQAESKEGEQVMAYIS